MAEKYKDESKHDSIAVRVRCSCRENKRTGYQDHGRKWHECKCYFRENVTCDWTIATWSISVRWLQRCQHTGLLSSQEMSGVFMLFQAQAVDVHCNSHRHGILIWFDTWNNIQRTWGHGLCGIIFSVATSRKNPYQTPSLSSTPLGNSWWCRSKTSSVSERISRISSRIYLVMWASRYLKLSSLVMISADWAVFCFVIGFVMDNVGKQNCCCFFCF